MAMLHSLFIHDLSKPWRNMSVLLAIRHCRKLQAKICNGLGTTLQFIVVDESIGQTHDVLVHAVLVGELDDSAGMGFAEAFEERHL